MPENNTIPDPHLTREEAEALLVNCKGAITWFALGAAGVEDAFEPALEKLRNSLSAPLVEDGGVERVVAKRLFGLFACRDCAFEECDWSIRQHWLSEARSLLAAIQPFLGQGGREHWTLYLCEQHGPLPRACTRLGMKEPVGGRLECSFCEWDPERPPRFVKEITVSLAPTQQHKEEEKV